MTRIDEESAGALRLTGVCLVRLDGTVLARVGRFGNYDGQFQMAHSIHADVESSVYIGDITGARSSTHHDYPDASGAFRP
jgi:hypothetical protein